jgi:outer membrane protein assembly factor BamB
MGDEVLYGGPCSTPEYDPATGHLYTLSIDGDLAAWDGTERGKKLWGFNLYDRYGARRRPKVGAGGLQRDYGYTSAPLVWRDWLLVEVGGTDGNLAAFDRRTGKRVWVSDCKDLAGHTGGPALLSAEGVPCVAVLTLTRLVVVRLDAGSEGKTLGSYPWATEWANNIASPAVHGDCVLVTSAYNQKAICKLRVSKDGVKKVWEAPYPSKACTPVIHQGHVYYAWQKVRCLDFETGKQKWEGGFVGDPGSCLVTADGRLVVWGQMGRLLLVETAGRSPDSYRELARLDRVFAVHAWPHVALAGGRLFCKDRRGNIKCFRLPRVP